MRYNMRKNGFSLIELSIVIVAISLIIAGIISGQSLLRSTRILAVSSNITEYLSSIDSFKEKYMGLPGDLINASDYFPDCSDAANNPCNGDGNGSLEEILARKECTRSWQHLSFGKFTKLITTGFALTPPIIGETIPESSISQAGYWMCDEGVGNRIYLGYTDASNDIKGAVLTPPEAESIDKKLDDGAATTGNVTAEDGTGKTGCLASGDYNFSNTNIECIMLFAIEE